MSSLRLKKQILLDERNALAAPELQVSQWFNTDQPLSLQALRGRVVVLHTFQMLCPGCVSHGIPQASSIFEAFPSDEVAVVGLHTVFEHHEAMTPLALQAFMHEYWIQFPVGIDMVSKNGPMPLTMQSYGLRGTPSLVLIDKQGRIRLHHFGRIDDLYLGAVIATLVSEEAVTVNRQTIEQREAGLPQEVECNDEGCTLPQVR